MTREVEWGVRHVTGGHIERQNSRAEALRYVSFLEAEPGETEVVFRLMSSWIPEAVSDGVPALALPATECTNCKGTNLGFECSSRPPGLSAAPDVVEFYQGCNDCSETLWVADWDLFHAVLTYIYDMKVPRLD